MACHKVVSLYAILNMVNGKSYIGQTVRPSTRWGDHQKLLRKGTHHNAHLQSAWRKYGEAAFQYAVVDEYPVSLADRMEEKWITQMGLNGGNGYNIRPGGLRTAHSSDTRKKLSLVRRAAMAADPTFRDRVILPMQQARWSAPDSRSKFRAALKKAMTPEHRARLSEAAKARCSSPEWRRRFAEFNHRRWARAGEREKLSEANYRRWSRPGEREKLAERNRLFGAKRAAARKRDEQGRFVNDNGP